MRKIPPAPWLDRLQKRLGAGREDLGVEAVHELRVACGRLIVWLDLGDRRLLRDDLRWLRGSAATVRDLDVVLARFGSKPWARPLSEQRELAATDLHRLLPSDRARGTIEALSALPFPREDVALERVARLKRRALRAGDRLGNCEEDVSRVHRLRRAVRRLRYALEWIDEAPDELAGLQAELGTINDLSITIRILSDRGEDVGRADREAVEDELREMCARIRRIWEATCAGVEAL